MPSPHPEFNVRDANGFRLNVVWSRSGKTAGIGIIGSYPFFFAQVGLSAAQVRMLADEILARRPSRHRADDAPDPEIELRDPDDDRNWMHIEWNRKGDRLTLTVAPHYWDDRDLPKAVLNENEVQRLVGFLAAGSPSLAGGPGPEAARYRDA